MELNKTATRLDPWRAAARQQRRVKRAKRLSACRKLKPARKPEISNLKNMPNTNAEFEKNTKHYKLCRIGDKCSHISKKYPLTKNITP